MMFRAQIFPTCVVRPPLRRRRDDRDIIVALTADEEGGPL
jgi:hypothetical protein